MVRMEIKQCTMTTKQTFESSLLQLASKSDPKQVFIDFLAVTVNIFNSNPSSSTMMEIYSRYAGDEIKDQFPKILNCLLEEMHEKQKSINGNDVLGEFCQKYYYNGIDKEKQILTWAECENASRSVMPYKKIISAHWPIELLDVGCRSGRIMIATLRGYDNRISFHGVEYDWVYILISSLNLFFNHCQDSEILWVDQANGNSFKESYFISPFPGWIIRNEKKEHSKTWRLYQAYLETKRIVAGNL